MHDNQLVLKCLLTYNGEIFEKSSLAFLVKFLYYYVYHLNPRVKVIRDPCDIILTILKEDYTTMLFYYLHFDTILMTIHVPQLLGVYRKFKKV